MGCGVSTGSSAAYEIKTKNVLTQHLTQAVGIDVEDPVLHAYVSALHENGFDTVDDFDQLSTARLRDPPYSFKDRHVEKVAAARKGETPSADGTASARAPAAQVSAASVARVLNGTQQIIPMIPPGLDVSRADTDTGPELEPPPTLEPRSDGANSGATTTLQAFYVAKIQALFRARVVRRRMYPQGDRTKLESWVTPRDAEEFFNAYGFRPSSDQVFVEALNREWRLRIVVGKERGLIVWHEASQTAVYFSQNSVSFQSPVVNRGESTRVSAMGDLDTAGAYEFPADLFTQVECGVPGRQVFDRELSGAATPHRKSWKQYKWANWSLRVGSDEADMVRKDDGFRMKLYDDGRFHLDRITEFAPELEGLSRSGSRPFRSTPAALPLELNSADLRPAAARAHWWMTEYLVEAHRYLLLCHPEGGDEVVICFTSTNFFFCSKRLAGLPVQWGSPEGLVVDASKQPYPGKERFDQLRHSLTSLEEDVVSYADWMPLPDAAALRKDGANEWGEDGMWLFDGDDEGCSISNRNHDVHSIQTQESSQPVVCFRLLTPAGAHTIWVPKPTTQ
jgi:hypothetical protein